MKFKYKKLGTGYIRPIIPIEISYKGQTVKHEVLVDSGADICVVDASFGIYLDIPITQGKQTTIVGVTSQEQKPIYLHKVTITVGGRKYTTNIGFMPDYQDRHGIVGQKGFFSLFSVTFDYNKEEIKIKEKS